MDLLINGSLKAYWHLWVLGSIIFGLFVFFIFRFLIPSQRLKRELDQAISKLQKTTVKGQPTNVELIGNEIMVSPKLKHCWEEFAESLHRQTAPDEFGQERVIRWRSTVPAEVFFNVETLIAVELRTEYFKHQPGILTGIGIIGTFVGLLRGLANFSVSDNPETVRASLDTLIHGVVEAFAVSATAIALAMVTTFIEKLIVTRRIKQVEDLCQSLDSLFEGGAGEEYLSRLVKAGESSATQTAQLKDALVSDLKEMLTELIHKQTEAIASSFQAGSQAQVQITEQSGDRIAKAITDSLSDPLQKISAAVNTTTDTNGQVVTRALNEALVTFSQKMEDMFGGQISNINQLLLQTTTAMQSTVSRFDQLANNINDAGKNAADAMSERLSHAIETMESRQAALNSTMNEFVTHMRDLVQVSQTETNEQLQHTLKVISDNAAKMTEQLQRQAGDSAESHQKALDSLGQKLGDMMEFINKQSVMTAKSHQDLQQSFAEQANTMVEQLSQQIKVMIVQANDSVESMRASVASMRDITKDNTQRMENSAGTLALAADNFAKSGNSVSGVMQQATVATDKIAATSMTLNSAAATVQTALSDYNNAGKVMAQMVAELKATVEAAKQDASVSQSLVNQIKQSAEHLQQAQSSVDGIFKEVCEELANAHEEFANNVVKGLKSSNTAYQKELKDAVDYLKTAIEELGEVAEKIPARA
jgi:hypothetical protein